MSKQRLATWLQRRRRVPAVRLALVIVPLLLVTAACDSLRANERAKRSTLTPWESARVGTEPAKTYLLKRSGVLLVGVDGMVPETRNETTVSVPVLHGNELEAIGGGAAVAIDERGYWLTAAHCLENQPMMLLTSDGEYLRWWAVRVVWDGFENSGGERVDLALLHVRGKPFAVMPYSASPPRSGPVLCCGSGLKSEKFFAGNITAFDAGRDAVGCITLVHDAPAAYGDSGGPAMHADGTLAGINVEATRHFLGTGAPSTTALCPDPAFLRGLIERDVGSGAASASP